MCLLSVALSMKSMIFKSCPNLTTLTCPLPFHNDKVTIPNSTKVLGRFFLSCCSVSSRVLISRQTFKRLFLVMYFAFFGPTLLFGCLFLSFRYIKIKTLQIDCNY